MRCDQLAALVKLAVSLALVLLIVRGLSQSLTRAAAPISGALVATR